MSHRANLFGRGYSDRESDPPRLRFRRALAASLVTIFAPGSAQTLMGQKASRLLGRSVLAASLVQIAIASWVIWMYRHDRARALGWAVNPRVALGVSIAIVVCAVIWLLVFVDAWRLAKTDLLPRGRKWVTSFINVAIIVAMVATTAIATRVLSVQREVVSKVFSSTKSSGPLNGQYNILLIGSDSGSTRVGVRPDSMTVVSINAQTGRPVLISIPRNLEYVPFPEGSPMLKFWPNGFNCGDECLINAVYQDATTRGKIYPGVKDQGLAATMDAVQGATGLKINYYALVNLQGFQSLVDAVGGVVVDVRTRIAMFGAEDTWRNEWLEPGKRKLNGRQALWYARSRYGADDYFRMARQKCLMSNMLAQLDPQTVLLNATAIGKSSTKLMSTDIPQKDLGAFADLALKARDQQIKTVSLVPPLVDPTAPDWASIYETVRKAIHPKPKPKPTATTAPVSPKPSPTVENKARKDSQIDANATDDLKSVC